MRWVVYKNGPYQVSDKASLRSTSNPSNARYATLKEVEYLERVRSLHKMLLDCGIQASFLGREVKAELNDKLFEAMKVLVYQYNRVEF